MHLGGTKFVGQAFVIFEIVLPSQHNARLDTHHLGAWSVSGWRFRFRAPCLQPSDRPAVFSGPYEFPPRGGPPCPAASKVEVGGWHYFFGRIG